MVLQVGNQSSKAEMEEEKNENFDQVPLPFPSGVPTVVQGDVATSDPPAYAEVGVRRKCKKGKACLLFSVFLNLGLLILAIVLVCKLARLGKEDDYLKKDELVLLDDYAQLIGNLFIVRVPRDVIINKYKEPMSEMERFEFYARRPNCHRKHHLG